MSRWSSSEVGGIAGIAFAVGIAVFALGLQIDSPAVGDPPEEIRNYFADNGNRFFISSWITSLLFLGAFLTFASALATLLPRERDDEVWAKLLFGSAVASVAVGGAGMVFWSAIALDPTTVPDETIRLMMDLDAVIYAFVMPWGFAVFLASASLLILRTRALWPWLAWLGLATGLVLIVGSLWVLDGDPESGLGISLWVGLTATLVWALIGGVGLYRLEDAPR